MDREKPWGGRLPLQTLGLFPSPVEKVESDATAVPGGRGGS